jgi:DNA polymerase, archaea type
LIPFQYNEYYYSAIIITYRMHLTSDNPVNTPEILLDISYLRYSDNSDELAELVIHTRSVNRKRNRHFIRGYLPYFYVECSIEKLNEILNTEHLFQEWFVSYEKIEKTKYHGGAFIKVLKVFGKQPWLVPSIRSVFDKFQISYYEADIPFTHRFMIDFNLKGMVGVNFTSSDQISLIPISNVDHDIEPRICSLDIEIDVSNEQGSFDQLVKQASQRITAIGFTSSINEAGENKIFVLQKDSDRHEKSMIKEAFHYLWKNVDPDILVTYNGDNFDIPYLLSRLRRLEIPLTILSPFGDSEPIKSRFGSSWHISGVLVFDLFKRTRWMYTADGRKTLQSVAQELLGKGKVELTQSHGELWKDTIKNSEINDEFLCKSYDYRSPTEDNTDTDNFKAKSNFEEYVAKDASLTLELWTAMNMQNWLEVIKISGAPPQDAMQFTERQAGEFLVYQIMYKQDILIPAAPTTEKRKARKSSRKSAPGGLVLSPIRDISQSVLICDFASMYPSIIMAHNIGGESFDGIDKPLLSRFNTNPKSSMAIMQKQMLEKRKLVKKQLATEIDDKTRKKLQAYSFALKLVSNSTFGSYNYIGSRFYDTNIASTITEIGQSYLRDLTFMASEFGTGYQAIYGDTDSVFIETPLHDEIKSLWELPVDQATEKWKKIDGISKLLNSLTKNLPVELSLELQDIAYRIIFHQGAKKRYAYVSAITKNISILGFESIRHDWSPFAKKIQKITFELLLTTGDLVYTKNQIIKAIQENLNLPSEELKNEFITQGPIKRDLDKYKVKTPAVAAFHHYMNIKNRDPKAEWKEYDYFPYIVVKGKSAQWERAKHPDLVNLDDIDVEHYVDEALRAVNRFNLNITKNEALGIKYSNLWDFFS